MTALGQSIGLERLPLRYPRPAKRPWHSFAFQRLNRVFETAQVVPFDDTARIIFFSDIHRGDNGPADAFVRNKALFLAALTHYYREGYTYIEVGDGDELWKNHRFSDIRHAHTCVFDLLHQFNRQNRLHLILGNHDIVDNRARRVDKDGILTHEGLILRHTRTGQQVFVVHGHQADFTSDRLNGTGRFVIRYVWKRLQLRGWVATASREDQKNKQGIIERRIVEWVEAHRQTTICGHTHRPASTRYGAAPYFNTGSCVYPGYITGLELQDGKLHLVKWTAQSGSTQTQTLPIQREPLAPPIKLRLLR
jgi:UDP-2,3-diacylglucosamine pyrophosphatase LpxH